MTEHFDEVRERIDGLTRRGAGMQEIELLLDGTALDADARDALWLMAWCRLPERDRARFLRLPVIELSAN